MMTRKRVLKVKVILTATTVVMLYLTLTTPLHLVAESSTAELELVSDPTYSLSGLPIVEEVLERRYPKLEKQLPAFGSSVLNSSLSFGYYISCHNIRSWGHENLAADANNANHYRFGD